MYYFEFKKLKFISFCIAFTIFSVLLLTFAKAEQDELVFVPEDSKSVQEDISEDDNQEETFVYRKPKARNSIVKRKIRQYEDVGISDGAFALGQRGLTFSGLVFRVISIIAFLISAIILMKFFLGRDRFNKPGSFIEEIAQKFTGGFSNQNSMKLKQTLMLTPGQNVYLVEIEGKKLLLGGTQQGGVQFLSDLTGQKTEKIDLRMLEPRLTQEINSLSEVNKPLKQQEVSVNGNIESPFMTSNESNENGLPDEVRQNIVSNGTHLKQTFRKRSSFRQSILSDSSLSQRQ